MFWRLWEILNERVLKYFMILCVFWFWLSFVLIWLFIVFLIVIFGIRCVDVKWSDLIKICWFVSRLFILGNVFKENLVNWMLVILVDLLIWKGNVLFLRNCCCGCFWDWICCWVYLGLSGRNWFDLFLIFDDIVVLGFWCGEV